MLYSNSYLHDIWKYIQNFTWNFKEKLELNFQNTTYCSSLQPIPADTGRKLNVHKTFRRRPGCLLNVLCTFNLRPVSTEMVACSSSKIKKIFTAPFSDYLTCSWQICGMVFLLNMSSCVHLSFKQNTSKNHAKQISRAMYKKLGWFGKILLFPTIS